MSYTSTNILPETTSLDRVYEIINWLGYDSYEINTEIPKQIGNYGWSGDKQFKSFVGVELQVYKKNGIITIDTRTRAGRSYWDLKQQNKTIQTFKNFFGGSFETDEGKDILFEEEKEPTLLESGLFLQRWIFHNDIGKIQVLDMNINDDCIQPLTGIPWLDEFNYDVILNNLKISYLIGAWEKYLKSTFVVLIKCAEERDKIFKSLINKAKLLPHYMESFSQNSESVEWLLSEWMSFQRPKNIIENFKIVDNKMDINAQFMKPSSNRKNGYYDRIDHLIDIRNDIVHAANIDHTMSSEKFKEYLEDIVKVVDRIYSYLEKYYKVKLRYDF